MVQDSRAVGCDRLQVRFDDERSVANAGIVLPGLLADRLGLEALVDAHVDLGDRVGAANPGRKVMSLVSAIALGADCIDDCDVLRSVPVSGELVRCYSEYMHDEYGNLDSDYVFVNLWGGQVGRAMTYANVNEIVTRTHARVDFHFTAHMLRHTYATLARRGRVPMEVISTLLTHTSVQTTSDICVHSTAEDRRGELERAGVMATLERAL